jgi:histidinol dehydrogenase
MRIYEGSPRQNFEEVLRSIGAFLDQRGMREILLLETPDGFVVQGLTIERSTAGAWSEHVGQQVKETFTFLDDDIARFMDEQKPRDVFFFEQDGSFVIRLLTWTQQGSRHVIAEFTREDVEQMIAAAPALRDEKQKPKAGA